MRKYQGSTFQVVIQVKNRGLSQLDGGSTVKECWFLVDEWNRVCCFNLNPSGYEPSIVICHLWLCVSLPTVFSTARGTEWVHNTRLRLCKLLDPMPQVVIWAHVILKQDMDSVISIPLMAIFWDQLVLRSNNMNSLLMCLNNWSDRPPNSHFWSKSSFRTPPIPAQTYLFTMIFAHV